MCQFSLQLFYQHNQDQAFAHTEAQKLHDLVSYLAQHIVLQIHVLQATNPKTHPTSNLPYHDPTDGISQTLLIVDALGAAGYGWQGRGCVNKAIMQAKIANYERSQDITIHEWIHTLVGESINGRTVPFADDCRGARKFPQTVEVDSKSHWYNWFRYCLGVPTQQITGLNLPPNWTLPPFCC